LTSGLSPPSRTGAAPTHYTLKNDMGGVCAARFEDQLADVITFIDPIFTGDLPDTATWDPLTYAWQ